MKPTAIILTLAAMPGLVLDSTASARDIYYVNDHLATTLAIIDDVEGKIAQLEADAFGSPMSHDGGIDNPARYTGKPHDEDLGAYVFPFRNYRSEEGRWMSADPSGFPDGINAHGYMATPTKSIDPLGLYVVFDGDMTTQMQQQFWDAANAMRDYNDAGAQAYADLMDPTKRVNIYNDSTGASGAYGGLPDGSWVQGAIGLDFSSPYFNTPPLPGDPAYGEFYESAMVSLAHEVGHALYNFHDISVDGLSNEGSSIIWENLFRPWNDQRSSYRGRSLTAEMIANGLNSINRALGRGNNGGGGGRE